jgi:hypothetical protein
MTCLRTPIYKNVYVLTPFPPFPRYSSFLPQPFSAAAVSARPCAITWLLAAVAVAAASAAASSAALT